MAIQRDRIMVVDIEATCWDVEPPPDGQVNEIIEIGFCLYDVVKDEIFGRRSILVKPTASVVSPFCTGLTTLTPEQVNEQGMDFVDACRILVEEYAARKMLWASWGGYDHKIFRRQCRRMAVSYPFGDRHMNVKKVFADCHQGRRMGMARALRHARIDPVGRQHRGDDDAWNCAQLLQYLVHQQGTDFIKRYW